MKYFIASDIHGSAAWCRKMLEAFEKEQADRLILLGDVLYHGPRNNLPDEYDPPKVIEMLNPLKNRILAICGNCDSAVDQMVEDRAGQAGALPLNYDRLFGSLIGKRAVEVART